MVDAEYIDAFISEAQDYVDSLNNDLLDLEGDSDNKEVVDKLFRSFHTLKGNAATMGFEEFSNLAHALEDLLDAVRNKKIAANGDLVDVLLEGADVLRDGLDSIKDTHEDVVDSSVIMPKVKQYLESGEEKAPIEPFKEEFPMDAKLKKKIASEGKRQTVLRVTLLFDEHNALRNAKAKLCKRKLSTVASILATQPSDIDKGILNVADFIVSSKEGKEAIEQLINGVSGVQHSCITSPGEPLPDTFHMHHKENKKQSVVKKNNDTAVKVQSVKIDLKRLDKLLNYVGELLISKMRLENLTKKYVDKELSSVVYNVDRLVKDIQDEIMEQRMIPVGQVFNRFPRMVRDLAKHEDKRVNLVIEGAEMELDRTILDAIGDPLVHMLRNSVDHGIEQPTARENAGKDPQGTIKLIAERQKTKAVIRVIDDGQGIDPDAVRDSILKKGIMPEEEVSKMTDKDLQMLVFMPKVSTNAQVTEVSGRGVGMDVVMNNIKKIGGTVKLDSQIGSGTEISIHLPLSMAIIATLIVELEDQKFAIPINSIDRIVDIKDSDIKSIQGQNVFVLNGEPIQLLYTDSRMNLRHMQSSVYTAVIVESDDARMAICVDSIVTQQQILIKGLDDDSLRGMVGVSGAAILGDGTVALVMDVNALMGGALDRMNQVN
ncbi:MAG: chemotaxis protein CheA [Nanoarchaeota archaeon]